MKTLSPELNEKLEGLKKILQEMDSLLVGMSGGVDSVLLAVVAHQVLGARALAVTADSPSLPRRELAEARHLAQQFGFPHRVIYTEETRLPDYIANPVNRCYFCKNELFDQLDQLAQTEGYRWISYGENLDDRTDHRPGGLAAQEHRVRAPLKEAGLTKGEIRQLAQALGLPIWDKPAMACLASRIPYGSPVTPEKLAQIEAAENYLSDLGFRQFRVRHHEEIARIEVAPARMTEVLQRGQEINAYLKSLGFTFVALDLAGYRRGSLNEGQPLIQLERIEVSNENGAGK